MTTIFRWFLRIAIPSLALWAWRRYLDRKDVASPATYPS
jgi:hypothetical protein